MRGTFGKKSIMNKVKTLAFTFLFLMINCDNHKTYHFESYFDGNFKLKSALIIHSFNEFPIGQRSGNFMNSVGASSLFQNYAVKSNKLFDLDITNDCCSTIKLSSAASYICGDHSSYFCRLYKDTIVSISICDVSFSENHMNACKKLISSRFGNFHAVENNDEARYNWEENGIQVVLFYRHSDHFYSIDVDSPRSDQYWEKMPIYYKML
jgi:hypothetical protein